MEIRGRTQKGLQIHMVIPMQRLLFSCCLCFYLFNFICFNPNQWRAIGSADNKKNHQNITA